jgi:DNA-binding protein YbaB
MNDALNKSKQAAAEAMQEVTGGLNIPGMEGMMSKLGLGSGS